MGDSHMHIGSPSKRRNAPTVQLMQTGQPPHVRGPISQQVIHQGRPGDLSHDRDKQESRKPRCFRFTFTRFTQRVMATASPSRSLKSPPPRSVEQRRARRAELRQFYGIKGGETAVAEENEGAGKRGDPLDIGGSYSSLGPT